MYCHIELLLLYFYAAQRSQRHIPSAWAKLKKKSEEERWIEHHPTWFVPFTFLARYAAHKDLFDAKISNLVITQHALFVGVYVYFNSV
jgi:hypothetical protein